MTNRGRQRETERERVRERQTGRQTYGGTDRELKKIGREKKTILTF